MQSYRHTPRCNKKSIGDRRRKGGLIKLEKELIEEQPEQPMDIEKFDEVMALVKEKEAEQPEPTPEQQQEPEEPPEQKYKFNLKLMRLANRIKALEEQQESMANRVNELLNAKVNPNIPEVTPPEEEKAEENTDIEEVNEETEENNTEVVEHPEFTNKEEVNKDNLTDKQLGALELINKGLSNKEIGEELGISSVMAFKYRKKLTEEGFIG